MKIGWRSIRYVLFIGSMIIWVLSAKIFIGNFSIEKEIQNTINKGKETEENTLWKKNFEEKYLKTEYATYFSKHSARQFIGDEILVMTKNSYAMQEIKVEKEEENSITKKIKQKSNQEKWNSFFKNKIRMVLDK